MSARTATVSTGAWVMRLALLALGAAVLLGGIGYGVETPEGLVGPGMMPVAAGALMVVAGAWECLKAFRAERSAVAAAPAEADGAGADGVAADEAAQLDVFGRTSRQRNRAVAVVFGVILLAVVLAYAIGLLLALSLMVVVLLTFVEKKPLWVGLVAGVGAFAFGYLVFGMALNVPLATGALGLI
ncbi:tripartite tricarboxylate transporter TctB family protein [Puerhibacterium sp. TATVAM-FAB25]|uniref:tripartite tricarboxylate transporter TctB family protein n=1 Tax=Puerhibacterium sp. TATVAM-FAB25 TaxID=3093699 RepID=UPI00397D3B98